MRDLSTPLAPTHGKPKKRKTARKAKRAARKATKAAKLVTRGRAIQKKVGYNAGRNPVAPVSAKKKARKIDKGEKLVRRGMKKAGIKISTKAKDRPTSKRYKKKK